MFTLAAFSVGDAILILVGQKLGEGRLEEGYMLAKKLLRFSIVIGIIGGLGLFVTSPILVEFFNFTAAGNETAIAIMRIFAATMAPVVYHKFIGWKEAGGEDVYTEKALKKISVTKNMKFIAQFEAIEAGKIIVTYEAEVSVAPGTSRFCP